MRIGMVHTESGCLVKTYSFENAGENSLALLPKGSVVSNIKVVVEEAFNVGTLELKVDGAVGEYGKAIDLKSVKVTDITGKGILRERQEIVANITGAPTAGGVSVHVEFFHPTREEKGI